MNHFGFHAALVSQRGFRATLLLFLSWLMVLSLSAAPCNRIHSQRDAWVTQRVNVLVRAARAAYENDKAQRAYERVLDSIAGTMKQCRLTDDRDFVNRYPEFVEYVKILSLSRQSDHCIDRAVKLGPRSESDRAIVNDEIGVGLAEFHMVVLETEGTQLLVSLLHELEVPRRIENDLMALVKQFVYGFKGARQGLTLVVFTGFLLREDGSIYVNQESHACLPVRAGKETASSSNGSSLLPGESGLRVVPNP